MILSLLCDHALILHPEQMARLEDKQPAFTVGSLRDHCRSEAFLDCIRPADTGGGRPGRAIRATGRDIESHLSFGPLVQTHERKGLGAAAA